VRNREQGWLCRAIRNLPALTSVSDDMPLSTPNGFTPYEAPLLREANACTLCEAHLPLGPRPVFRIHPEAKIALISQAPGRC